MSHTCRLCDADAKAQAHGYCHGCLDYLTEPWDFARYRVTLRHDGGVTVLDTVARDADTARMIVCNAESAPPSAVVWTEKLPD